MLELRDVSKSFGGPAGRRVLDGVSLTVVPGEYVAIVGESGVGKSTLLNLIAGLDVPDSGALLLEDRDLAQLGEDARTQVRRTRMGFVLPGLPPVAASQHRPQCRVTAGPERAGRSCSR